MGRETIIEAIAKSQSICIFAEKKVEAENVKSYSIVGIGYPKQDADLEAMARFDATRIFYNKY